MPVPQVKAVISEEKQTAEAAEPTTARRRRAALPQTEEPEVQGRQLTNPLASGVPEGRQLVTDAQGVSRLMGTAGLAWLSLGLY